MPSKKAAQRKSANKPRARKASSSESVAKKTARSGKTLAKKADSAASKVSRKTKQIAQGAQKVGAVMGTIGDLVKKGGEAAEDMVLKVEASRKTVGRPDTAGRTTRKGAKKS